MNKLGIKVYGNDVYEIDGIGFSINSINHVIYDYNYKCRYRMINSKWFGIKLLITKRR